MKTKTEIEDFRDYTFGHEDTVEQARRLDGYIGSMEYNTLQPWLRRAYRRYRLGLDYLMSAQRMYESHDVESLSAIHGGPK